MVARVLASVPAGAAPLVDWLEAWATAAIVDGRAEAIGVDGVAMLMDGAAVGALLCRIDAAVRDAAGVALPVVELLVAVAGEGRATVGFAVRTEGGPGFRSVATMPMESVLTDRLARTGGRRT